MKKDDEKGCPKETTYHILKDPYFYLTVFLWLSAFCLAVYVISIGAIVPH